MSNTNGAVKKRVGVLALQGDFDAHAKAITLAGGDAVEVRTAEQLQSVDGLVIPGGESTTMLKLLNMMNLVEPLAEFAATKPVFGTCAGAILLASEVLNPSQQSFAAIDLTVERNAYGRQIDSAIITAETSLPGGPLEMVFIRAPRIASVGASVETLARRDEFPTLVRQGSVLAATFHPELSSDRRVHKFFVQIVLAAH